MSKISTLLPFLDDEEIKDLVEKALKGDLNNMKLTMVYPFADQETMNMIVDHFIKEGQAKKIMTTVPFLEKAKINEIYELAHSKKIEGLREEMLMPFLGKNKIKELFKNMLDKNDFSSDDEDDDDEE
ncbi:hypothetical protein CI105_04555 [Candidatus Izimaplasma bacterium ZiA1]|uniref:hypothetical protein n=1 Tax=Candidatus Izimoplasma sp. ZiA1 TaxID=2024899 RepID=UPI000BAA4C31|nr:hypothetical protein CI105_04555 [Candidatus Izimaplasma bacterium ZiA1]